jgi:hypothetical protein
VRKSGRAVVGEGGSGVTRIGEDGPGDNNEGGVLGGGNVVGERGDPWGGERRRVSHSPPPLNSSASQRLFTAFLVRFAGGGEGIGE